MLGQQGGQQDELFYSFSLESHVPGDHLLRGIDRCLDLSELRQQLAPYASCGSSWRRTTATPGGRRSTRS